jgi:predicted RND superfamily exporter protein
VSDVLSRIFRRLGRLRVAVIVVYAALVPVAAILAARIPHEGTIDRLIVPSDPDYIATREFQKIFPEPQLALLVFEADDPWSPASIGRINRAAKLVAAVPHVGVFSPLDALRRVRPNADPQVLHELATGTDFFRRQGLIGDHFMTLIANLDVASPQDRDAALGAIDAVLDGEQVRRIGAPYVSSWLEREAGAATGRSFAVFGVLLVLVTLFFFRSVRAVLAIVIALGVTVVLALAAGALCGFAFTIVSSLVPLTVMVTTLASLTYIHLRFVDQPEEDVPITEHQVIALRNKFLPVTASMLAAALGFAALAVSTILPIREMGVWTAIGLAISWLVSFTLFPALQLVLRTPTGRRVSVRSRVYDRLSQALPRATYRYRVPLVAGAVALMAAGAFAVGGMSIQVDALSNIDPNTTVYRDLRWFREHVMSLDMVRVWIHLPRPTATDPEVLRTVDRFDTAIGGMPDVTGVAGPTTVLRMRSYFAGHGDKLPADPTKFAAAVADVEQLLLTEADLRTFIDANGLADLQLAVLFHDGNAGAYESLSRRIRAMWHQVGAGEPAVAGARVDVVGEQLLQVKVGANLLPTLAWSLLLTVGFILIVFLVVFRSPLERLLAMIPSAFALLVTFLGLRLFGGMLNIATIIIATTVLGTTENDQLHLFHHMHERTGAPLEERLRHTLHVSGRAILFATIINASGFLALSVSRFPPLRQFGVMTAAAFVLAMFADFLVLPAAMWIVSREKPASPASEA